MLNVDPSRPVYKALFIILGFTFIAFGLAAVAAPLLIFRNPWSAMALGPFAILFGLVFILGAIFKPGIFR